MSISVVNGYVCTSGCDVAKAKQGQDPHAPPGAPPSDSASKSGFDGQPATILDGALKQLAAGGAESGAPSANQPSSSANLLV